MPEPTDRAGRLAPLEGGEQTTPISASPPFAGASAPAEPLDGNPPPVYPYVARLRGMEGRVVLAVEVPPGGRAGAVEVVESSGHYLLDEAARTAVRRWRFRPAMVAGRPQTATLRVPIRFRLDR